MKRAAAAEVLLHTLLRSSRKKINNPDSDMCAGLAYMRTRALAFSALKTAAGGALAVGARGAVRGRGVRRRGERRRLLLYRVEDEGEERWRCKNFLRL